MTKWYESDNPDRIGMSIGLRILLIVAVIAAIGIGVWVFKVQTSDVKGAGDVQRTKNAAPNRIGAQERFESLYAGIKAADQRIDIMAAALAKAPTDVVAQTNYTGSQTFCTQLVADYNAEARKITAADWRSPDLPQQIDPSDPSTDCKETSK